MCIISSLPMKLYSSSNLVIRPSPPVMVLFLENKDSPVVFFAYRFVALIRACVSALIFAFILSASSFASATLSFSVCIFSSPVYFSLELSESSSSSSDVDPFADTFSPESSSSELVVSCVLA